MDESFADTLAKDGMPEDVQKKLSSILEKYDKLSDEEKEQFQKGAFDVLTKSFSELNNDSILPIWLVPYQSYILFIFALSVVAFLLGTTFLVLLRFYKRVY